MNNNHTTSFWFFIQNHRIEIPIIQRDYAQGRVGKEYLRKMFLQNLKQALDGTLADGSEILKLDFVYSSNHNDIVQPLDGQQRLTTLWLLHWYIALRSGKLAEASDILQHFTYETRISSREFCENLCKPNYFDKYEPGSSIVDYITNQTWFYSSWKQDPTIQSMLRMLGGTNSKYEGVSLEQVFKCPDCVISHAKVCAFQTYWNKLTSDHAPLIFYHLHLQDFGLSDDLYIKMNARGKQLTSFENFKADLIGYIRERAKEDPLWNNQLLNPISGIPIKMDTTWTDLFWKNRSIGFMSDGKIMKNNQIDEIYFAFINRFFWNELFTTKDENGQYLLHLGEGILPDGAKTYAIENENSSYSHLNSDNIDAYADFEPYKFQKEKIPIEVFYRLQKVIDRYLAYTKALPECAWDKGFRFIPEYELDESGQYNCEIKNSSKESLLSTTSLNQVQRIAFFAICKYFVEGDGEETSLRKWMRVVWNLISGQGEDGRPQIRSTQAVRTAIEHIDMLASHDVYNSLKSLNHDNGTSDFSCRWNEEIDKATQILDGGQCPDGDTWENVIVKAERYAFFKGGIRFLYQDENGNPDWTLFERKWERAKNYFQEVALPKASVMKEPYHNADLLKVMMSWFTADTFWSVLWGNHRTFNNKPETWLYYLLNRDNCKAVHHLMLGERNENLTSPLLSDFANRTVYLLANTSLLDYVRERIPNSWIRDYHNHKAIFPSGTGVFLNASQRDSLLAFTPEITIRDEHKIPNTLLLFGSDINFIYQNNNFQWYRTDYIYLMEPSDFKTYKVKNEKVEDEIEKYYCFKIQIEDDNNSFAEKLKRLIDDASI